MISIDIPALTADSVSGAKLYADRVDMMLDLVSEGGHVCEIGVALGDFSELIARNKKPATFTAIDVFDLHTHVQLWGQSAAKIFSGKTHEEFYRGRIAPQVPILRIEKGFSRDTLPRLPERHFSFIYVDGEHDYENVHIDAMHAARMLHSDGVLIFNDYVLQDPFANADYGVVQAVNELVIAGGWRVVGFALQRHMFCDIALVRA